MSAAHTELHTQAQPFADAQEHLDMMLISVWLLLQRHVAHYGYRMLGQNKGENLSDAISGFAQSMDMVRTCGHLHQNEPWHKGQWPAAQEITHTLQIHGQHTSLRLQNSFDASFPLEDLRAAFSLSDEDLLFLVCVAAPQLSHDLAKACQVASSAPNTSLTCAFFAELFAETPREARKLLYTLDNTHPLVRHGLLTLTPQGLAPRDAHLAVSPSALRFLCGITRNLPENLAPFATLHSATAARPSKDLIVAKSTRTQLLGALRTAFRRKGHARIALQGPRGTGRRSLLHAHLAELGTGILEIDLACLLSSDNATDLLDNLCLEASLRRCALLLRRTHTDPKPSAHQEATLRLRLKRFAGIVAISSSETDASHTDLLPNAVQITFPDLSLTERKTLWETALSPHMAPEPTRALSVQLAEQLRATPGIVIQGVKDSTRAPSWNRTPQKRHLLISQSVRTLQGHSLSELAAPMTTTLNWDDAVLAEETCESLEELVIHATHQNKVLDLWGLGRKLPYGKSISCLLYGPPGTGKTMTATLLAKRLNLPLFKVELSKIVSKYVGETEKNLAELFDQAERAEGILLFDEADSLFSKRTKVKDSQDRFANAKINYLLQRMESYNGISILTTNLDKDLDDALKRRLRFKIYFPSPDVELRAKLWESLVPAEAVDPEGIDFEAIAEEFELSGGHIKNAVLRAAFQAAHLGSPITTELLYDSAIREARELGMLVRG